MKNILAVLISFLILNIIFCYSWCLCLEKNQNLIILELNEFQKQHFKKEQELEKEIRLLQQDVQILKEGWD